MKFTQRRWNAVRIALNAAVCLCAAALLVRGIQQGENLAIWGWSLLLLSNLLMIPLRVWKHYGLPKEE
jgi:sulfur relay (sulfurtransferase) complex TusBCD TusD component (DsrE family)